MGRTGLTDALPLDDEAVPSSSRRDLVARARAGDQVAYTALVQEHFPAILRMARAITGNEADARDVTQDTFVAIWRGLPTLRDDERFEPWLHQVLRHRCLDLLRRRRRVREIAIAEDDVIVDAPDAESLDRAALLAAFDRLSLDERRILVLHHLEGRPVAEVARVLGIPVGTVKSRLFAARRSMQRVLEGTR